MTMVTLDGKPYDAPAPKPYQPAFIGMLTAYITGPKACRDAAVAQIAKLCGGATATIASGYWDAPNGEQHIEPCIRLEAAFSTGDQYASAVQILNDCAKRGEQTHIMHSVLFTSDRFGVVIEEVK